MIELSNINIKFQKPVITNGEITIPDGKITAIAGDSGSGKTTLLYLLGLISSNSEYSYTFDGTQVDIHNDVICSQYRKTKIGYVFQDSSVIGSLTVGDNIRLAGYIAGVTVTDEEIANSLKYVDLNVDANIYPKQLSGGEQQRLAMACAIAKKPELIVADEPTSSLDSGNEKAILKILRKMAADGKKVVVATHNNTVSSWADVIYHIENQHITLTKGQAETTTGALKESAPLKKLSNIVKPSFALLYAGKTNKKKRIQKALMLVLCAVAIALMVSATGMGDTFINNQNNLMNKISNREILLVNATVPNYTVLNSDAFLSIEKQDYIELENISELDQIYPYYEFRSYGTTDRGDFDSLPIQIAVENQLKTYSFQYYNVDTFTPYSAFVIVPYYPEQEISKQLQFVCDEQCKSGIFLSAPLAELLNVQKDKSCSVTLEVGVPVYTTERNILVYQEGDEPDWGQEVTADNLSKEAEENGYAADYDVFNVSELKLDIEGVLDNSITNRYSDSGYNIIYMPFAMMEQIRVKTQNETQYQSTPQQPLKPWAPSAYMLYAKSYNSVKTVMQKAHSVNVNFMAKSDYQDIDSMNEMMAGVKTTVFWIVLAVLIIVTILMTIIFMNYTLGRKIEIALLKANGLTKKEVLKLIVYESFFQYLIIVLLGALICILVGSIANSLSAYPLIEMSLPSFGLLLFISMAAVLLPTIVSALVVIKIKPDRILRN